MSFIKCVSAGVLLSVIAASIAETTFGQTGENNLVSSVPGTFSNGTSINNLIGANRFYNAGIFGQGTITANVEAGHIWNGQEALTHVKATADLCYFLADYYRATGELTEAKRLLQSALEGSGGVFVLRARAINLSKQIDETK